MGFAAFSTERLLLRGWRAADLPAFAAMNAGPVVRRYFATPLTAAESDLQATRFQRRLEENGFGFMAVGLRDGGAATPRRRQSACFSRRGARLACM